MNRDEARSIISEVVNIPVADLADDTIIGRDPDWLGGLLVMLSGKIIVINPREPLRVGGLIDQMTA